MYYCLLCFLQVVLCFHCWEQYLTLLSSLFLDLVMMLKLNFQLEWGELSNKISNDYSLLKDYLLSERCHCICSLLFCSHGYNCLLFFAFRCVLSFCMGTIYIYILKQECCQACWSLWLLASHLNNPCVTGAVKVGLLT